MIDARRPIVDQHGLFPWAIAKASEAVCSSTSDKLQQVVNPFTIPRLKMRALLALTAAAAWAGVVTGDQGDMEHKVSPRSNRPTHRFCTGTLRQT